MSGRPRRGRGADWEERSVARDPRGDHSWPVVYKGVTHGLVTLVRGKFEARTSNGFLVGRYSTLTDGYNALLTRPGDGGCCG
jgi:hypothetical protein